MTIEFFEKMCDIDSDKTYVSKAKLNGTELPLYAVEEKINICNEKEYKYYSYNQRTNNYSMRSLLWDEAEYIEFLYNHRTDELQKLIDSGKLYREILLMGYRIKSRFIYKQVGQRLKQLRNQKGVSQKVVADYLGVDRSTYTNYEMGTTTMTYVTILMLARYFSVDFNTLLCYDLQTPN